MKRNIRTKIKTVTLHQDEYRFESLDKMFTDAKTFIKANESGFVKIRVIEDNETDSFTTYLDVFSLRLETNEEEAARIARDIHFREIEKKHAEEKEKRLYERLKTKYEKA